MEPDGAEISQKNDKNMDQENRVDRGKKTERTSEFDPFDIMKASPFKATRGQIRGQDGNSLGFPENGVIAGAQRVTAQRLKELNEANVKLAIDVEEFEQTVELGGGQLSRAIGDFHEQYLLRSHAITQLYDELLETTSIRILPLTKRDSRTAGEWQKSLDNFQTELRGLNKGLQTVYQKFHAHVEKIRLNAGVSRGVQATSVAE